MIAQLTEYKEGTTKLVKPCSRGLFEPAVRLLDSANMIEKIRMDEARRLFNAYKLIQMNMEEGILNNGLPDGPSEVDGKREDDPNCMRLNHRTKRLSS